MITLSRNFGHQVALSAGIDRASGELTVMMDGDLQDPPEVIPALVSEWREGWDVVYAVKRSRQEGVWKRVAFKAFYAIMRRVAEVDLPPGAGNFSLMSERVIKVGFSRLPLRVAFFGGSAVSVASMAVGVWVLYERLFTTNAISGWASTIVSITFLGGAILLMLGVIGEYIGRIYDEVKRRPLYVVDEAPSPCDRAERPAGRRHSS